MLAGGLGQLRGALGGDLVAGMEGEQVGHVPVAHLYLLVLLQPLLQGAVGGHLRLGQVFQDFLKLGGQFLLAAQQLRWDGHSGSPGRGWAKPPSGPWRPG